MAIAGQDFLFSNSSISSFASLMNFDIVFIVSLWGSVTVAALVRQIDSIIGVFCISPEFVH
jgi:hypothetical protein